VSVIQGDNIIVPHRTQLCNVFADSTTNCMLKTAEVSKQIYYKAVSCVVQ